MPKSITQNTLFYGDNLTILRDYIPDESIDLIYLDPPFNSSRDYNVLFKDESGQDSEAQITAFEDTWHWGNTAEETYYELATGKRTTTAEVSEAIEALRNLVGENQMMAYLVMMAARLVELHRVLKPTGSLYLHCDPTASHYLKIILDAIFSPQNFRNEIIWQRSQPKSHTSKRFSSSHDILLFYAKSSQAVFNQQYKPHDPEYIKKQYRYVEPETGRRYRLGDLTNPNKNRPNLTYEFPPGSGVIRVWRWTKERMMKEWEEGRVIIPDKGKVAVYKRYLDEMPGTPIDDLWIDIEHLHGSNKENLGYPTQKPIALLERIIQASSNEGDWVLDPFCGCGTAIDAAQKLKRRWIGIDITHLSVALLKYRLEDRYRLKAGQDYVVVGEPESLEGAKQLAQEDRYQFQWWALSLIRAKPLGGQSGSKKGKKGKDRGIDGIINFIADRGMIKRVLVQVKSGKVSVRDIRDLRGTLEREDDAEIGVFITLNDPTKDMKIEAVSAGFYENPHWGKVPRIQILTIEQLLNGKTIQMPAIIATHKKAEREQTSDSKQEPLL